MLSCTGGSIDDSNFGKPMPIIGLYIAGATLVSTILMVIDLIEGFKSKQYWIPANYFSINAASLTVIGVAIKLSVDLNSPMPSRMDQIAKLATSAFICVVLADYIPFSVVKLKKGDRRANTIALELLILTSAVNVCIQLKSGAIHAFRGAHIFMIVLMFVFLVMCFITSSLVLPDLRFALQRQYEKLHQQALKESFGDGIENVKDGLKLKEYLMKFSMMAQSGCPHIFFMRSPACIVVAAYGLMSASAFVFAALAIITHRDKMVGLNTCSGESDYEWSVLVILVTQSIAIITGLVAPLSRMIYFIKARAVGHTSSNYPIEQLSSNYPIIQLLYYLLAFIPTTPPVANYPIIQMSNSLGPYFLHSEEEKEGSIEFMMKSCSRVIQKFVNAEKEKPENLIRFLKNKLISHDFGGVLLFEGDLPPVISYSDGPPTSSWALPMVTLICIAVALPRQSRSDQQLKKIMVEGLVYVKLVEDILNGMDDSLIIRHAAEVVGGSFNAWLPGVNLDKLSHICKGPKNALLMLADSAKERFSKMDDGLELVNTYRSQAVAAHSMYRICQTILQYYENNPGLSEDGMFDMLCGWIADILGAYFTNLRECIFQACKRSTIEDRRETAFRMLKLFGQTEEITKIVEENGRKIPDLPSEKLASIDEWRLYLRSQRQEGQSRTESNHLGIV